MIQSYIQAVLFHSNWNVAVSHWLLLELGTERVQACTPNILRSRHVARTPPVEARSSGRRSSVENTPPSTPVIGQPAARSHPAERSHYVVISRDGRKLVTRVRSYVAIATQPVHWLQIRPIVHN